MHPAVATVHLAVVTVHPANLSCTLLISCWVRTVELCGTLSVTPPGAVSSVTLLEGKGGWCKPLFGHLHKVLSANRIQKARV